MSETTTPQEAIASSLVEVSEQTRLLVSEEVQAVKRETLERVRAWAVPGAMFAAGGASAVVALVTSLHFGMRILEKLLPPAMARFVAMIGFGTLAGVLVVKGAQRAKDLPAPLPVETARQTRLRRHKPEIVGPRSPGPPMTCRNGGPKLPP